TNDVYARLERHKKWYENYSSKFAPWDLLWFTKKENRSEAVILELKLKYLSKARLKSFISKYSSHIEGRDE
ncbi:MAG: GIY-YIG nuclease family protein, partial [Saprospiraceae bacterium]|nr:GIY-YIG nuclease family protein [Saprospiraceae bacterium]